MREEAFGEIGVLPEDFYRMEFSDYLLLKKGYYKKQIYEQRLLRNVVTIAIAPHLQKPPTPEKIWPIDGDSELRKKRTEKMESETIRVLNMHKEGGFVYVKIGGKIVQVKKENN